MAEIAKLKPLKLWAKSLSFIEQNDPEVLASTRSVGLHTFKRLSCEQFLRHYCYVVYASGFKAATIQSIFDRLESAFCDFDLSRLSRMRSLRKPLAVFRSDRKARNFLSGAHLIAAEGWTNYKKRLASGGVYLLTELPGIGPITKDHLAKNIGMADVVKADIWLERAAALCGKNSPDELVDEICKATGETRNTVDVVIWYHGKECAFGVKG